MIPFSSLLLERWVPGVADDEGSEHRPNPRPGPGDSDGGRAGADELGRAVDVFARRGGLQCAHLHARGGRGPRSLQELVQ